MLRTQDDAKVLVGDTLADRPNAAEMPQGTTFHDVSAKSWWVLCIDPVTQIRFWDPASGSALSGPALLKWAGGGTDASTFLIADDPGATNTNSTAPAYPLATARIAQNFAVNLRANPSLGDVAVTLLVNGIGILTVNFLAGTGSGIIIDSAIGIVPAGATIDVQVVALKSPTGILVSATVELV